MHEIYFGHKTLPFPPTHDWPLLKSKTGLKQQRENPYVSTNGATMNTFNSFYSNYYNHNQQHNSHHGRYYQYFTNLQGLHGQPPSPSTESCPDSVNNTPTDVIDQPRFYSSSPKVTPPRTESPSNSAKVIYSQKNHNHHHHSIQELIRHFGKKVHQWRSEGGYRRASCSEDSPRKGQENDEFRERSKSLDGATKRPQANDCEATYRIYDTILKQGTCHSIFFLLWVTCVCISKK